ncbi:hypothetical protein NEOLEDRAFT_1150158 [Neolentinus lepideus HHB14362 ss-1]|uniref:Fungal-type protein kinase domain-containing protein n=1 Tax=Neolentinus lepideus HHB14362 ss-1 TaxID=1314782 RepID=A0A165QAY2_9AGAM|nr:hypothetical protein NEOLEDRAFT_1150158 [Neolentinus lepideus HHB14362 ss-1]
MSATVPPMPLSDTSQEVHESESQSRRETIARAAQQRESPSVGASIKELITTQRHERVDAIYNYRPVYLTPPPITIYHPVFTKFLEIMEQDIDVTHEELGHAQMFIDQAVRVYKYPSDRINRLSAIKTAVHQQILGITPLGFGDTEFLTDGIIFSAEASDEFKSVICFTEVRNEMGWGGHDPVAQAECAYVATYSSDEARCVRQLCCCPALLIGIAGPHIIIRGAVFAEQLITQNLTDYISLVPLLAAGRSALGDTSYRVARFFRALKECIKILDEYYTGLVQMISPPPGRITGTRFYGQDASSGARTDMSALRIPTFIGPHFTEYYDTANRKVVLTYRKRLDVATSDRAVFLAEADIESKPVEVVTPKLWYCKYEPSVWMWVVVMEYVKGREVEDTLTDPAHIESLWVAVKTSHANDFVFGDLRWVNVFTMDSKVILIDFDWCGKAGEVRYPSDISLNADMHWHPKVQRGVLIEKEHDMHLFRVLTGEDL